MRNISKNRKSLISRKRKFNKSKRSKKHKLKKQTGAGCCGKCGKSLKKKYNLGPRPYGASK